MKVLDNFDMWLIDWITCGKEEVRKELYENVEKTTTDDFMVYGVKDIARFRMKVKSCLVSNKLANRKKLKKLLDEQLLNRYSDFEVKLKGLEEYYKKIAS